MLGSIGIGNQYSASPEKHSASMNLTGKKNTDGVKHGDGENNICLIDGIFTTKQ